MLFQEKNETFGTDGLFIAQIGSCTGKLILEIFFYNKKIVSIYEIFTALAVSQQVFALFREAGFENIF